MKNRQQLVKTKMISMNSNLIQTNQVLQNKIIINFPKKKNNNQSEVQRMIPKNTRSKDQLKLMSLLRLQVLWKATFNFQNKNKNKKNQNKNKNKTPNIAIKIWQNNYQNSKTKPTREKNKNKNLLQIDHLRYFTRVVKTKTKMRNRMMLQHNH